MDKLIDAALGIHPRTLRLATRRLELIANNVANADTPGFKARDIDFRNVLANAAESSGQDAATPRRTHSAHQAAMGAAIDAEPMYRVPIHPSLDGNTVDSQLEQAAFAEAAVRYQASLDFVDKRIAGLRKVLRGE